MADIDAIYTLATPGGTITFNSGSQSSSGEDEIRITDIQGLDGPPIRAPIDDMPFGDGGLSHNFWKGPRHMTFDGIFLIVSVPLGDATRPIRNDFEEDLRVALESISEDTADTGSLSWQPEGQAFRTLTVRHDVQYVTGRTDNNLTETWSFGLVADDPAWV